MGRDSLVCTEGWYLIPSPPLMLPLELGPQFWTFNMPAFSAAMDDSSHTYPCLVFSLAFPLMQI